MRWINNNTSRRARTRAGRSKLVVCALQLPILDVTACISLNDARIISGLQAQTKAQLAGSTWQAEMSRNRLELRMTEILGLKLTGCNG
jgi:hypothetical protein